MDITTNYDYENYDYDSDNPCGEFVEIDGYKYWQLSTYSSEKKD